MLREQCQSGFPVNIVPISCISMTQILLMIYSEIGTPVIPFT
jgi:hypothetical protein